MSATSPLAERLGWAPAAGFAGPENSARRTGAALAASALGVLPLRQVFTDWAWLPDVWVAMALTLGPAALLRMRWVARSVHLLPGLVLATCYLTARFVPDHAWGGVLPLRGAWPDINALISSFGDTIRDGSAPLHSTAALRMMLAVQLTLLAVVVDLVAVVARRPALAGVPFLLLFTLAGAVPRQSVGWVWFALAAAGYLLLLASETRDELSRWGRLMPRSTGGSRAAVRALSARRIGVIAIVVALAVPLVLPLRKSNLLADALHGGTGTGGGGGGVSLDPFVKLKGQLVRGGDTKLLTVTTSGLGTHRPLYLREQVLDVFNRSGWVLGSRGPSQQLASTSFAADPDTAAPDISAFTYAATLTSVNLKDSATPLFQVPRAVAGLSDSAPWSSRDATLGAHISQGDSYTETVAEPEPSISQLNRSPSVAKQANVGYWLQHSGVRPEVSRLVDRLTKGLSSPYLRTLAILDYFSPENGFTYSLSTQQGDSGDDLVDFLLQTQTGYCQQYAASMAIMLRLAGVPSRVVVGYTHSAPDENGSFTVTSNDAHAWVEAYFAGAGWLPFDPTPLAGADLARSAQIPWAPKPNATAPNPGASGSSSAQNPDVPSRGGPSNATGNARGAGSGAHGLPAWAGWLILALVVVLILAVLLPAFVRWRRRRARLRAADHGPDPLWQELADTAVDLGYVWSPVRSPRQVVSWLRREGVSGDAGGALQTLARAVEISRYADPNGHAAGPELIGELRRVEGSLRSRRTRSERLRARLLPDSLGWPRRRSGRRH